MKPLRLTLLFCSLLFGACSLGTKPSDLKCDYMTAPLGIENSHPILTWTLVSETPAYVQKAFEVTVTTQEGIPVYCSGKTDGAQMALVLPDTVHLDSYTRYLWRVVVWGNDSKESVSAQTWFETAKLAVGDAPVSWEAKWISDAADKEYRPAPMFRKRLNVDKKLLSARAYVSGLGYYLMSVNGKPIVGSGSLEPGFTDYSKRFLYVTHDITDQLQRGDNVVGFVLGNGWFNNQTATVWNFQKAPWRARPQLLCEIHLLYTDGTKSVVSSDTDWKTATGGLLYDNLYCGVVYDAQKEPKGWDAPGFDDSGWGNAIQVAAPQGVCVAQAMPPVGSNRTIVPRSVHKVNDRCYVFDMGENFAGVARLKVNGQAGVRIAMTHGELLKADGRVDQANISMHLRPTRPEEVIQTDVYVLRGEGKEEFTPPFTYHGFQYVEVNLSEPMVLTVDNLEGVVMHSLVEPIGTFSCSDELLNTIYDNCKRSYLSNLFGIPTDCPHREKNGWMADGHMVQEAGMLNYDSRNIYRKWVNDMMDAQDSTGNVPGIVPTSWNWDSNWAGPIWDAALFIVPEELYRYYNDESALLAIYETGKRYINYIETKIEKNGVLNHGLGDWLFYKAYTPVDLMTSCYLVQNYRTMARIAQMKGEHEAKTEYLKKSAKMADRINELFLNQEEGVYANKTQLSYALPLYMGIVPKELEKKVVDGLVRSIVENGYGLDFGFIGSKVVPIVLSNYGYDEVMYKMATKTTMPSWGFWIKEQNATTMFEAWDYQRNLGDASLNHPSMGSLSAWMVKSIGGINATANGFRQIVIRPAFLKELSFAKASYRSASGFIASEWHRDGAKVVLSVEIPANTSAEIVLPDRTEKVGSGKYTFEIVQ